MGSKTRQYSRFAIRGGCQGICRQKLRRAEMRIVLFGPSPLRISRRAQCPPRGQVGSGVALFSAARKRKRACIKAAVRSWISGDASPDSNNNSNSVSTSRSRR